MFILQIKIQIDADVVFDVLCIVFNSVYFYFRYLEQRNKAVKTWLFGLIIAELCELKTWSSAGGLCKI